MAAEVSASSLGDVPLEITHALQTLDQLNGLDGDSMFQVNQQSKSHRFNMSSNKKKTYLV